MAALGPKTFPVPGYPRWIVDATATPDRWYEPDRLVLNVRLNVKHRRLMAAWALLTGRVHRA